MILQYINYLYLIGPALLVFLLIWVALRRMQKNRNINIREASLTVEELEEHARNIALEHSVSSKKNILNWPLTRMNDSYSFIRQVYEELNMDIMNKRVLPATAEWILDNYYVIEEQVKGLRRDLSKKSYYDLPVLKKGPYKGFTRIFAIAMEFVAHTDGQIEETTLLKYIEAYQSHSILFEREVCIIPAMLRLALIENIRMISENIIETRKQWNFADEIVEEWLSETAADSDKIARLFKNNSKVIDEANPSFIEHLFYRLRISGRRYSDVLRYIDENLDKSDTTAEIIAQKEHNAQAVSTVSMKNCIVSLKYVSSLNWTDLFEAASYLEKILKQDPDGTYSLMDINSRGYYRNQIEKLAKTYGVSELYIAREALSLAQNATLDLSKSANNENQEERISHIGYYIIGNGIQELENRQKGTIRVFTRVIKWIEKRQGILYMSSIGLFTIILVLLGIAYALNFTAANWFLYAILTAAAVIIPASEIAISIINWVVCKVKKTAVFPRLELKDGIPDSMITMVVIPALLSDKKRVTQLLENMENHYLANKERNLYFALIGALKDSEHQNNSDDMSVVQEAFNRIEALNNRYAKGEKDIFYFYNRLRKFNEIDNNWTGWERKRGALMEFNELLLGSQNTTFSFYSNELLPDANIKYVITLDADTVLPIGMAKKMIGTMAHPLNKPVIDMEKGIVVEGYGLMQPRVSFDSDSSNRSAFSRIYTGQEGLDPYASAISDVYQDLFGEGIFTGKGIYDLKVFHDVLKDMLPENSILSHDLLEGSFVRAALVSDLELVDSYPSKYNSFMARLHRWIRGDWQLIPWLGRKICTRDKTLIRNPLSYISKWKIMDNLRRSLVAPTILALMILGFTILPGSSSFWFGFGIVALGLPLAISLLTQLFNGGLKPDSVKRHMPGFFGLKASAFQFLLRVIFLPHQAFTAMEAVIVTLIRVLVTRKNMLEWVTSADADKVQSNSLKSYLSTMGVSAAAGVAIAALPYYFKAENLKLSFALLIAWGFAPIIAFYISKDDHIEAEKLEAIDLLELRKIARKTWRYFEEFANLKNNYLPPDNFQEDPYRGISYKTSPTNIGLGLMASLTARDMGYIGLIETTDIISKTITSIEKMEKWNGHLYNWYDTRTLEPFKPMYVSTVDSGNLTCYLTTLVQGLKEYRNRPLVDAAFARGIKDTFRASLEEGQELPLDFTAFDFMEKPANIDLELWKKALDEFVEGTMLTSMKRHEWKTKNDHMGRMFIEELKSFMPWVEISCATPDQLLDTGLIEKTNLLMKLLRTNSSLIGLPALSISISKQCDQLIDDIGEIEDGPFATELAWLNEIKEAAYKSAEFSHAFIEQYDRLINRIDDISMNARFSMLYNDRTNLFSIGYNIEEKKLTNSYYDLLASEARKTSYIAIARGEIPLKHWFMLGRSLTTVNRYKGLVSWSGTMFEYLMPLLVMRNYKNTLLDETYSFVIKSQMKYGKQREMPWGTSESAYNSLDMNLDYQYKAIGVPWLGLKRGLADDAVTAPYATFLALMVNPVEAYENIKYLKAEGLEGLYGFYEAADYTPERLEMQTKRVIIKSFMSHHQGMSLMALNNYLNNNTMQIRFSADPFVKATRLLLQEKVPLNVIFTKDRKEKIRHSKGSAYSDRGSYRHFTAPNFDFPKAHILSNGNYSVMLTDKGTGYTRDREADISRWREDSVMDYYGMFFYVKNIEKNQNWSATYAPFNVLPKNYEVDFTTDKAVYKRTDGDIETMTEVVVASGDNAEIRRIKLKNNGKTACTLEVTSYFELVLAAHNSDLAHPVFSNLFVSTEFDHQYQALLANRRPRSQSERKLWIAEIPTIEGETADDIQYETDRMQFIGRGHTVYNPDIIERGKSLSNTVGSVLDPIFSMRARVKIEPGKTARIFFVTVTADSKESIMELVEKYAHVESCNATFWLALTRSQVEARYLNIKAPEMELYQELITDILFISPQRIKYGQMIKENRKGQEALWQYGISGDRPIVLLILDKTDEMKLLYEMLKAHEYWRLKDLRVDLVILSQEENSYTNPLYALIKEIIYATQTYDVLNRHKDVFILKTTLMTSQDINLFYTKARMVFKGSCGTMEEQMNASFQVDEDPLDHIGNLEYILDGRNKQVPSTRKEMGEQEKLQYFNGLGGFGNEGRSYVIKLENNQMTPAPWINVIANPDFGFMVSETGGGYTWCENSSENKLSPWSNDPVSDEPGEVLYIGEESGELWSMTPLPIREEEPYTIEHGFGYSQFLHKSHGIEQELVQFVPVSGTVKISMIHLQNESSRNRNLSVTYYMTPVLGVSTSETAMHLISSQTSEGTLIIENPYNRELNDSVCFMDASMEDRTISGDRKEFFGRGRFDSPDALKWKHLSGVTGAGYNPCAAMQIKISLMANEATDIVFVMGMAENVDDASKLADKFKTVQQATESLAEVKLYWEQKLQTIEVDTPDSAMNIMLNGWLQYQVISCRMWARSGFYQAGGAYGFRDQLQDALSLAVTYPSLARNQILKHAGHQFQEGDVLHWWHEPAGKGTRTRSSDDYLWLPYVTAEYIKITGDFEILKSKIPFLEEDLLKDSEDDRYCQPKISVENFSLYDHCIRSVENALQFGEHELPLIRGGDWNDGMNTVGNEGKGESIWLGWMLCTTLQKVIPICREMGDDKRADGYSILIGKITGAIEKNGWDGNWYIRAFFDSGEPLGSADNLSLIHI